MIGDMGYGALILLLSLKLKKAVRPMLRDIGSILLSVSLWSIVWGAAWGEFFGDAGHRLFHLEPLWVERSVSVLPVVVFTVALGAAHVFSDFSWAYTRGSGTATGTSGWKRQAIWPCSWHSSRDSSS